ncbi:hypothetical protein INR49_016372, partial [Caranx melampygus]
MLSYMDYVTQGALEPRSRVSAVMTPGNTADDQLITTHKPVFSNERLMETSSSASLTEGCGIVWTGTGTGLDSFGAGRGLDLQTVWSCDHHLYPEMLNTSERPHAQCDSTWCRDRFSDLRSV